MKDKITYRVALVARYLFERKETFKQIRALLWWLWMLGFTFNAVATWLVDSTAVWNSIGVLIWMLILTIETELEKHRRSR